MLDAFTLGTREKPVRRRKYILGPMPPTNAAAIYRATVNKFPSSRGALKKDETWQKKETVPCPFSYHKRNNSLSSLS